MCMIAAGRRCVTQESLKMSTEVFKRGKREEEMSSTRREVDVPRRLLMEGYKAWETCPIWYTDYPLLFVKDELDMVLEMF
jgi:hypothetical protein